MPACSHTRSLVCEIESKEAHEYSQVGRITRHSLRNGCTAYTRSPRCTGLLATVARENRPRTYPASEDQDHAISPSALDAFVNCAKASIASRTTFRDDREAPLVEVRDGGRKS